ncbi:hypothetical protein SAMN02745133_01282 [Desulforamulus putei DSM 12395]|uniref:Uncharacterized protein n=1 Tax=Desulforamulus putei DSM 12395 TaxID=1121429 RepID=A0A1M4WX13_9FIRM|nr:hypothetical protein SAMN02745133_01282 [Desulforamulus putei DSM 12395]
MLCNRLYTLTIACPNCGQDLDDLGLIQDFYGPYSAYEDQKNFEDGYKGYTDDCCVHLLACNSCAFREFRPMKRLWEQAVTNEMPELTDITSIDNPVHCP